MDGNRFHGRAACGASSEGQQIKRNARWLGGKSLCHAVVRAARVGVHKSQYLVPQRSFQVEIMLACVQLLCNHSSQCHQGRYYDDSAVIHSWASPPANRYSLALNLSPSLPVKVTEDRHRFTSRSQTVISSHVLEKLSQPTHRMFGPSSDVIIGCPPVLVKVCLFTSRLIGNKSRKRHFQINFSVAHRESWNESV